MPNLKKMLQGYDLDLLERIAPFWGVDATNMDMTGLVQSLDQAMQDSQLLNEMVESLPPEAKSIWVTLCHPSNKITWAEFTRKHGEVREFGPARREREAPDQHPISPVEVLWYRGLIGRAFMNLPPEPREFVFVPDELNSTTGTIQNHSINDFHPEIIPDSDIRRKALADGRLLDHVTDWLASRRMARQIPAEIWKAWHISESFVSGLALESGFINAAGEPITETLPAFFQSPRDNMLIKLYDVWMKSIHINDLRNLPGLIFEGQLQNDPVRARVTILSLIGNLEPGCWYDLKSFLNEIKRINPDFQRPSGDYDSWFIRKTDSETYLRGFAHWDDIDGALLRYLILGPMHWLGMIDLASTGSQSKGTAFKQSALLDHYLGQTPFNPQPEKESPISISSDLVFTVPLLASRTLRYQLGRFCELIIATAEASSYELTASSLQKAQDAGLKLSQLQQLLEKQPKSSIPKNLVLLVERWEKNGLESKFENVTLLRCGSPDDLLELRQNPYTARYILELLTPTTAIIQQAGVKAIKKALLEQGLLSQINLDV